MATANDYFKEVGLPGSATTLASPGFSIGNTTINVGSTANWPTTTGVTFAMDTGTIQVIGGQNVFVRTPGSYTEYDGVVSSGTAITGLVLRTGTAQNYPAGSTTRVYIPVTSSRENRQVQGLLVSHNQDGTIKSTAVPDGSVTASKIVDSSITDVKIDFGSRPWAVATFSTFGSSGGQVVPVNVDTALTFDALETNGHTGVSMTTPGQLKVASAGVYNVVLNTNISDGPQTNNYHMIEYSIDSGSSWVRCRGYPVPLDMALNTGLPTATSQVNLPTNAIVRGIYRSNGGQTRVAADTFNNKYVCSLSIARIA